jgi:hypothetical protein
VFRRGTFRADCHHHEASDMLLVEGVHKAADLDFYTDF